MQASVLGKPRSQVCGQVYMNSLKWFGTFNDKGHVYDKSLVYNDSNNNNLFTVKYPQNAQLTLQLKLITHVGSILIHSLFLKH